MQPEELFEPRVLIVSGKGGVGKTTVAAALALIAARRGRTVCIAEVDRKGTLPRLFGSAELTYTPREMSPGVWGMNIVPEAALAEYLEVQYRMRRISRIFSSSHFVDYITTAAPGLKDILVLGKIWYLEQNRQGAPGQPRFDTIIVDAPAAGHMLTFLSAPVGLSDAIRVGPVRKQAEWLLDMVTDPKRTRVHLVTLAEEMPVSETLETAEALRTRVGIAAGVVFANAVYEPLLTTPERKQLTDLVATGEFGPRDASGRQASAAQSEGSPWDPLLTEGKSVGLELDNSDLDALVGYARFLQARRTIQGTHLKSLKKGLDEPVAHIPFLFSAGLALPDIETIADAIEQRVEAL